MKKLMSLILALIMVLSVSTMLASTVSADILEGDWLTSRAADAYEEGADGYTPASGYKYTTEGFQTVTADFTNCNPYVQAHTKQAYNLKDPNADGNGNAISVKFTVTEFAYNGEFQNKDSWISITLNSEMRAAQGHTTYGSGLCILIRGSGTGAATAQPHYVDEGSNTFRNFVQGQINPTVNADGLEEYTFSIKHDGTKYIMNICGTEFTDTTGVLDGILDQYCADGAYLGITLMTTDIETPASLLITEFQGATPYGEDSADPEPNVKSFAELADSSTVPAGQPAVKWDGNIEQCETITISNADFEVKDNGIVTIKAQTPDPYITFNVKNEISYEASDFPVIAILTRNCWATSGQSYYMAGRNLGASSDCLYDFIIDEVALGEGWGLSFIDLTDDPDWVGRINGIRVDFKGIDTTDPDDSVFDLAYYGAFRSIEDATQYANDYLIALLGKMPETTERPTEEPTTEAPETDPAEDDSEQNVTEEQTTEAEKSEKACGGIVAAPVFALVAVLGVGLVAKKKD